MRWLIQMGIVLFGACLASGQEAIKPSALDSDPSLVGWWKLNETDGKLAADAARTPHPALLTGALSFAPESTAGPTRGALKFSGGDAVLTVKGFKGIAGTKARTLSAWIKTSSPQGEIISWGQRDFGKMWILGFIRGHVGVTPSGGYYYMKASIHDDVWHHVAVVVQPGDPPNLHDHVRLFHDGVLAEVDDIGLLDLWPIDTGAEQDVRIGSRFKGQLRDIRMYERALSEDEIKALFDVGK